VPIRSWTCAPSARSVDALVDASSALTLPTKAKTLAAAATIERKVMTNLLELAISKQ
jgi:hypothetical protein